MDVAVARLSKVTVRTNGVIWSLNGSQWGRGQKSDGCGTVHLEEEPSPQHSTQHGPYGLMCQGLWEKHNFVALQTDKNQVGPFFSHHVHNGGDCWLLPSHLAGCWRSPRGCAKVRGFGDSLAGVMQYSAQKDCQGRWWGWQGSGVLLQLPLKFCHPAGCWMPHGATTGKHKIISGRLVTTLISSLPFSLNQASARAALTTCCSQLTILLRIFSEIPVLYFLNTANSENTWIHSYAKAWLTPVQFPGYWISGRRLPQGGTEGVWGPWMLSAPALAPCWSCLLSLSVAAEATILQGPPL